LFAGLLTLAHDVFISYSNVDKLAADAACAMLEAAGIRCWIAPRNLSPGTDWSAAIIEAIDHCTVMVLIFSSNTNESRQVHREVEYAVSREKTVIPVRIESVQPSGSLAYHIVGVHWLDALTPPLEDHLRRLAASVKALLTAAGQEHVREGDQAVLDDMLAGKQTMTGSDRNEKPAEQLGEREHGPRQQRSAGEHEAKVRPREHRLSGGALAVLASVVAAAALLIMVALSGMFRAQTAGSISGRVDAGLSRTLTGHSSQVQSIAFSPDSRILVSASLDKTIRLWDVASGNTSRTINANEAVWSIALSLDGRLLASASKDKTIRLWDVASGNTSRTINADGAIWAVAFSPDGRSLVSAGSTINLWDVQGGQLTSTLIGNGASSVTFSPDGRTLASGSDTIDLWEVNSSRRLFSLGGPNPFIRCIAFSPDGRTLASGDGDTVKLWDVRSGQLTSTLTGHTDKVRCVAYSPDGRTLASGGWDNTIKLWDTTSYQQLTTLIGHAARIVSLAYSPDGRTLASGGTDNTIKLWSVFQK
jgi:hypothetical protein